MGDKLYIKTCPTCGSEKIKRMVRDITRKYKKQTYTVPSVEFYNCPECGKKIYSREAMAKIKAYSLLSNVKNTKTNDAVVTRLWYGEGLVLDASQEALVTWSIGEMVSPLDFVEALYWAQYFGTQGRVLKDCLSQIERAVQMLEENTKLISNERILHAIGLITPGLAAFLTATNEITEWLDQHISKRARTIHNRLIKQHGPQQPPWHNNEDFKARLKDSSASFSLYLNALPESIQLIREIFPPNAPASWSEQLDRTSERIPNYQMVLDVGYEEATRRQAIRVGYLPSVSQ